MKCTVSKKSKGVQAAAPHKKGTVITEFDLQDNGDNTLTLLGKSAAGNVASLDPAEWSLDPPSTSSDTAIITVDNPGGMTTGVHAVGPLGTATITMTAKKNDGTVGPFEVSVVGTTKAGPANSVVVDLGTATVH